MTSDLIIKQFFLNFLIFYDLTNLFIKKLIKNAPVHFQEFYII